MLNVDFDPFEGLHDSENNNRTDPTTIHLGSEYQDFDQDNGGLFDGQSDEFNSEKGEDDYGDDDDSDSDSDVIVDIDNEIDDIDVDMSDFRMNIDEGVEYSGFGFNNDVEDEQETDEEEDLEVIDCDGWESLGEDSDTEKNRRVLLKRLGKEKVCSHGEVHKSSFYVGQMWKSKKDLKNKVDEHALETRRNLAFKKNDATRLRAYCKGVVLGTNVSGPHVDDGTSGASGSHVLGGTDKVNKGKGKAVNSKATTCTWHLYASRSSKDGNWYVKTYSLKHTCLQSRKIRACTATFLAKHITRQVQLNPTVPIRSLQEDFQQTYSVGISKHKMFRAKVRATKNVVGDYSKQYDLLRDYALELQSTNPNTTVKIDVVSEPNPNLATRHFKRIYICLGPLKLGFKAAVSLDSNNGIYPLAYAIVESENTGSWKWFLECLGDDFEIGSNSNFTFISDRQKGVIPAIEQLFPNTEHRYCLRHIHENMRKQWRAREFKEFIWRCATTTTIQEFQSTMRELAEYDRAAHDWLNQIPPMHWARSHFTDRAISHVLINNMCGVLNGKLEKGRDKPIITCLEFIREYLMKRICNVVKEQRKCQGPLTPTATKLLKKNEQQATEYIARWNGGGKYQVAGPWNDQHVVDINQMTCTCRKWELTVIPCMHAIATWSEMTDNGEMVGELYTWVHKVYLLDTWKVVYDFKVEPIKGRAMWPKSDCPTRIIPPPYHKMPGRPKKKRRQSMEERMSQKEKSSQIESVITSQSQTQGSKEVEKLSRKFGSVTCGKCKQKGHNKRTCKGQGAGQQEGGGANEGHGQE
ncbi:uncharacterized protein LOC128133411 [Lactuca sativa]|uniref:uncharacterized protein LOC128133411 n=1 Tax=Lactuca sativa TaxID=4236 RepID=UPI0022B045D3|nr:uncharacterized protein LOC128133411 [Lactuca sativa]